MSSNWNPKDLILIKKQPLAQRVKHIHLTAGPQMHQDSSVYGRMICSASHTKSTIYYPESKQTREVLMFGSNNYLGLATDHRLKEAAMKAVDTYGTSFCGSAILNGNSKLQKELEERTAYLKGAEDCMIFSAGFNANTAWTSSLLRTNDRVIYDDEAHMSFREGIKASPAGAWKFKHNNTEHLATILNKEHCGDTYIFTESLFSMTGDVVDLKETIALSQKHQALLLLDEAHGTGTLGPTGRGLVETLAKKSNDIVSIGTYSKALGSNGGFICGDRDFINYLRVLAPQYMFSAAHAPASMAAASTAVKILLEEPERVQSLRANALYLYKSLSDFKVQSEPGSPIVFVHVGDTLDVIKASKVLEHKGFFINPVSFPAVSKENSGLRITLSASHTKEEIDALATAMSEVWEELLKKEVTVKTI